MNPHWEPSNGPHMSHEFRSMSSRDFPFHGGNIMRIGSLILALIIVIFASATPSAIVKAQQTRNQTQSQEGLSEKNKKSLFRFGPEDVFGVNGEEAGKRGTAANGRQQRKGTPTPTPSAPAPRQAPVSAAAQAPAATQPSPPSAQSSVAPSPTILPASLNSGDQQSPLSQVGSADKIDSKWAAAVLILMALVVSGALIFTLSKLVEKIREGSSG
jgi:hypothetical protein